MIQVINKEASYGLMKIHLRNNVTSREAENKLRNFIMEEIGFCEIIQIAEGHLSA
jgi:hypothetical protein